MGEATIHNIVKGRGKVVEDKDVLSKLNCDVVSHISKDLPVTLDQRLGNLRKDEVI